MFASPASLLCSSATGTTFTLSPSHAIFGYAAPLALLAVIAPENVSHASACSNLAASARSFPSASYAPYAKYVSSESAGGASPFASASSAQLWFHWLASSADRRHACVLSSRSASPSIDALSCASRLRSVSNDAPPCVYICERLAPATTSGRQSLARSSRPSTTEPSSQRFCW